MPTETAFTVHHSCGHDQRHDLASKPCAERVGFARLLAWTPCSDCSQSVDDDVQSHDR